MTSTPTVKGASRIEQAFLESDQRKYYVPCPSVVSFKYYIGQISDGIRMKLENIYQKRLDMFVHIVNIK